MDENPYQPPTHYAAAPRRRVPLIAVFGNISLFVLGSTLAGVGSYQFKPQVVAAGLFWIVIALVGFGCMIAWWRRNSSP
jgi:hypothetical protein